MTIDLTRFTSAHEVVAPVINHWGKVGSRKFAVDAEDGWHRLSLGNTVTSLGEASPVGIYRALHARPYLLGYPLGEEVVPVNFDNFKRRGLNETVRVHFLNLRPFEVAKIVRWDDNRYYFLETDPRYDRQTIQSVRQCFEGRRPLTGVTGVTPELRYYYLVLSLERTTTDALAELDKFNLSESEKQARIGDIKRRVDVRIKSAITDAGATFVDFSPYHKGYLVTWRVGDQTVKSYVKDDLRIVSAGFCLSGDDKSHSLNSIINLAKLFQESRPLYITRE